MKRIAILFACIASFALSTCENQQVIHILSAPSELDFLSVIAYAGEYALPGGSAVEPSLRADVFDYTAYVDKDTTHFAIDAGIDGDGTLTVYSDQVTGDTATRFDLLGDEAVVTVKATRQYMETTEYRVTVTRGEPVPTAKDVEISVEPGIAAFFIGAGVTPVIKVTAVPPGAGVAMNYQWYVNDQNNGRTGNPITDANEDSYQMQAIETMTERTIYYYVEITTVFEGKTGMTQSAPCAVTFVNKGRLNEKSYAMADIPAGTVTAGDFNTWGSEFQNSEWGFVSVVPWVTPGFKMGRNLVTWELWKFVFDYADEANYRFANEGNQGARSDNNLAGTTVYPEPIGNKLHPVTNVSWRDAVVWCNAYSEMDGLDPVYRDKAGNVLRDSRRAVDMFVDFDAMAGYNGYRLPTNEEWKYAAAGAKFGGDHWLDKYPGTNSDNLNELRNYLWFFFLSTTGVENKTGEVGSRLPNQLWDGGKYVDGLYDMLGNVSQWVDSPPEQQINLVSYAKGTTLTFFRNSPLSISSNRGDIASILSVSTSSADQFIGFRVARNRGN